MTEFSKTDEKYQNTGFKIFYKQIRFKTQNATLSHITAKIEKNTDKEKKIIKQLSKKRAEYSQKANETES